jgi:DNA-binding NarL/FixJ family response regulator/EAL domain-containing protein (putative c-di-GMP-specific phosphodiesterase class I)
MKPQPQPPIRVLLAGDDPGAVAALTEVLRSDPRITVVAIAGDAEATVRLAAAHRPDVAFVDVKMPGGGPRVVRDIRRAAPGTRVVALSPQGDQASLKALLHAGAVGSVTKGAPVDETLEAVDRVTRGLTSSSGEATTWASTEAAEGLLRRKTEEPRAGLQAGEIEAVLEPGAIRAAYQPVFELATGSVVGYEALARFDREPRQGPKFWFAAATGAGLREQLELAAIRAHVARFAELPAPAYLSVNVSPSTAVSEELATLLLGLPMERLVLEISERAPVPDYEALQAGLARLRAQGARLAVDNAGAGFASLRHILQLAPDIIKLDTSLTRGVDADRTRRSLASAMIAFAGQMGIAVVAEGMETAAELATLVDLGVGYGQGFFLGRPGELPSADGAAATGRVATTERRDTTAAVRVAVVDDEPVVANAVAALLASEPGLEVAGVALDTAHAVELLDQSRPDVVVCDIRLGDESGFSLLDRYDSGRPAFVMYSSYDDPIYHRAAFEGGAAAFVLKMAQPEELVAAVVSAAAGRTSFSPSTMHAVRSVGEVPTARELAVLERLAEGQSTAEVAAALGIRPRTVESHLRSLFDRTGVLSRTELVLHAIRQGWIRPRATRSPDSRTGSARPEGWLVDMESLRVGRRTRMSSKRSSRRPAQ